MRFLLLLACAACAACGGHVADADAGATGDAAAPVTCDLAPSTYGTSCNVAGDCAAVFLGNACTSECVCANGAISASSLHQYNEDLFAATDGAPPECPCPQGQLPSCCKGQCTPGPCP